MESTLDIILVLLVLAVMDTLNEISPYLGFYFLLVSAVYITLKVIQFIRKWNK